MRKRSSLRSEQPSRIEPLAKLPVFWNLQGKRAIIASGSDAAAWKAELLAACGAIVEVYCESNEVEALMADLELAGTVVLQHHPWHLGIFHGAAMAIADCETEDEARAFACAARAAGVPFNVIDKPGYCQFQFGSIVNRSPVILSISTDGAAPILAQAIRRRIETLLPPSLKGWAALAQALRQTVNGQLEPGPKRRAFWEMFVDRCFSSMRVPGENDRQALVANIQALYHLPASGSISLVGAGPGDAELLTLKAVRSLQAADIILFDESVSPDVLELARREAKRMLVEAAGAKQTSQEEVRDMMVGLARAGKRVVLLRAAHTMASEEATADIAALRERGVKVEFVPGVYETSGPLSVHGSSDTSQIPQAASSRV
jgi:uroporphyrin-III C-methyltransferase / precorrin-2 dehydrogenase / sirohydrochlorin ferrochelatase